MSDRACKLRDCDRTHSSRGYCATHYRAERRRHQKAWISAYRYAQQCADGELCQGQTLEPHLLDFDHVRGRKRHNISEMVGRYGDEAIRDEIAKTEVVCALDHRQRTHDRRARR